MPVQITWKQKTFEDLTSTELYKILSLRHEVFGMEQNCLYRDMDGKDQYSFHLMGFAEKDILAAYSRIVFPGISYEEASIGRVVSSPKFRRTGLGKLLMEESLRQVENIYGEVPIRIGAQKYLYEFYKGFGFTNTGPEYLEDGIPHVIMLRPQKLISGN